MPKTKKRLKLDNKNKDTLCSIFIYEDVKLPMIMLQGWFSDQHECFRLFFQNLTPEEEVHLFNDSAVLESVKEKYKQVWTGREFKDSARQREGEHKQLGQLAFNWFSYWTACVSSAVAEAGSLESLVEGLDTVESAHDRFKPWFYKTKKVRNLNAADAARILARYGYVKPEGRPLLARGALRGAAILLDHAPSSRSIDELEEDYQDESKRIALEEKAAVFINDSEELSRFGKWRMEEGESWFCNEVHKKTASRASNMTNLPFVV